MKGNKARKERSEVEDDSRSTIHYHNGTLELWEESEEFRASLTYICRENQELSEMKQ